MRYLLVGNYGTANAGDDILREYFLQCFSEVSWEVCSVNPRTGELPRFPAGVRSFLSLQWLKTVRALQTSDGLVFGGGSLFCDAESSHASLIWFLHALWAVLLRKPVFLAFQGIGPFRTRLGEWCARFVVSRAAFISVRDQASLDLLLGRGGGRSGTGVPALSEARRSRTTCRVEVWKKNTEIVQSFDPSIALLKAKKHHSRSKNVFILIPRFSTGWTKEIRTKFHSILQELHALEMEVRVLSLQPSDRREQELCESLARGSPASVFSVSSLPEALPLMRGAGCVLTQRYHGALAALACGVPFCALRMAQGDKLDALAKWSRCPCKTLESCTLDLLVETNWAALAQDLASRRQEGEELVRRGEEALRRALCVHFTGKNTGTMKQ